MNKIYLLILVCILPYISRASHAMGADISYQSIGTQQFAVTYTFYRDCVGIPAPATISLDATGAITQTFTLNPTPNSPTYLHTTCQTATTTCNGGLYRGIEKWVYSDTITLPAGQVTLAHSENARNAALTTIAGAGSDNLYVFAVINNVSTDPNHSPLFLNEPTVAICEGNNYCLPSFVYDEDGDSLTFELITPRTGPLIADTVAYLNGLSGTQPFTSNPPVTIDHSTGDICLSPMTTEVTPVAILVSEYRNGILLGQVERDMQTAVEACSNNLPSPTGFNGTISTSLNLCAGQQNCFFITAHDQDTANTTFVNWDALLGNAIVTHSLGARDTFFVCWTPSDSDTIRNPLCFYASASDDNCPYSATTYLRLCINITPSYVCNPNGISENEIYDLSVYPQPAGDEINLVFPKVYNNKFLLLYDLLGKEIKRVAITEKSLRMNTSGLKSGFYYAAIADETGTMSVSRPVVVIH